MPRRVTKRRRVAEKLDQEFINWVFLSEDNTGLLVFGEFIERIHQ